MSYRRIFIMLHHRFVVLACQEIIWVVWHSRVISCQCHRIVDWIVIAKLIYATDVSELWKYGGSFVVSVVASWPRGHGFISSNRLRYFLCFCEYHPYQSCLGIEGFKMFGDFQIKVDFKYETFQCLFFVDNPTRPRYESGINVFVKKLFF